MRFARHRILSFLLLANYAGISLLGDGLHLLLPDGGHHHHHTTSINGLRCHVGEQDAHHHELDECCSEGVGALENEHARGSEGFQYGLKASLWGADAHLCEICSFIVNAIAQPVESATEIEWQPLVVESEPEVQAIYSVILLGPQAPRGPPLFAG